MSYLNNVNSRFSFMFCTTLVFISYLFSLQFNHLYSSTVCVGMLALGIHIKMERLVPFKCPDKVYTQHILGQGRGIFESRFMFKYYPPPNYIHIRISRLHFSRLKILELLLFIVLRPLWFPVVLKTLLAP